MRTARVALAALVTCVSATAACSKTASPRPQLLVVLDTDVPVPEFADEVRIELFDPTGTQSLATPRDVILSSASDLPISFGFRAADDASLGSARLRVRAYRSSDVVFDPSGAEPAAYSTIDRVVNLEAGPGVVGRVLVMLRGDCIGYPADVGAGVTCVDGGGVESAPDPEPVVPGLSPVPATIAGTWSAVRRTPCAGAPRPDTGVDDEDVCVPGGVFYFGIQQGQGTGCALGADECDRQPPQLAIVSPFFMDRYEVSVRRFRAALSDAARPFVPPTVPTLAGTVSQSPLGELAESCTWTSAPGPNELLPITCVDVPTARAFCQWAGGDLPTEVEWEYAGSRAFQAAKQPYPWGSAPPTCGGTRFGLFVQAPCAPDAGSAQDGGWPLPVAAPFPDLDAACSDAGCAVDETPSVDGSAPLVGLAGNVWELVRDVPAAASNSCWSARRDPMCLDAGLDADFEAGPDIRGGGWALGSEFLNMSVRTGRDSIIAGENVTAVEIGAVGFRCVRGGP